MLLLLQEQAQMLAAAHPDDVRASAAEGAYGDARSAIKKLPGLHWLAQEVCV